MSDNSQHLPRRNRSFVIREGRFTEGQKRAYQLFWPSFGIELKGHCTLNPAENFKDEQPLVLDIGFGSGDSLISLAMQKPDMNFIGVEVYRPGIGAALRRIHANELNNVRVINMDAMQLLKSHMPANILAGVAVWFPDPWPKTRHHKRRLVQNAFLIELARVMRPGSILHLASDWQPYVEFMEDHLADQDAFTRMTTNDNPLGITRPPTRFEQRGLRVGHQVTDLIYQRNG